LNNYSNIFIQPRQGKSTRTNTVALARPTNRQRLSRQTTGAGSLGNEANRLGQRANKWQANPATEGKIKGETSRNSYRKAVKGIRCIWGVSPVDRGVHYLSPVYKGSKFPEGKAQVKKQRAANPHMSL
jgi:hypothetical protein